jgi:branched-chain amino acid transport system substrate-binding protein
MEKNATMMMAVLLVVGLVIGGGVGYFMAPKEAAGEGETITITQDVLPMEDYTVRIGNIGSGTTSLETGVPWAQEVIEPALADYVEELGYDVTYTLLNDQAESQAAVHLEKVQSFKAMDVKIIHGGGWSSMAQAALSYVNENNVLLWSSSSTSPVLRIADDNLFRMCPDDTIQAPAICAALDTWGIKGIVFIQRADAWADGIYNYMIPELERLDIEVGDRVRYAGEVTEFSSYLATADIKIGELIDKYGVDHVAIEIIAFSEATTMVTQAIDYPNLWNVIWFGSDGTAMGSTTRDEAPDQAVQLRMLSTYASPPYKGPVFYHLMDESMRISDTPVGFYSLAAYDLYHNIVETTLMSQSEDPREVIPLIMDTCYRTWGVSGWTELNDGGDRGRSDYDIWGYGNDDTGTIAITKFGHYYSADGSVVWPATAESVDERPIEGLTPPGK